MSSIHSTNTKPELLLRHALFARGYRYRANSRELPGSPDIKFSSRRAVVFVHGCFWHGHVCRYFRFPATNRAFWADKIRKNRARDLRDVRALRELGWRVCVVWECTLRDMDEPAFKRLVDAVSSWLEGSIPFLELYGRSAMRGESPSASARNPIARNARLAEFVAEREARWPMPRTRTRAPTQTSP